MAFVEKVIISEFWGDHVVDISFFQDVNFLIGPNGSEKTTAINIIAAALSADFINLDRLPFGKVEITLNDPNTRRKPIIEVVKTKKNPSLFPSIEYSIKEKSTGEAKKYSLSDIEEDRMLRDYPHRWRQSRLYRTFFSDLTEKLAALAPTSWLSIHRAAGPRPVREEKSYEFSVDQKLEEISNSFVRIFSELDRKSSDETKKFQETIFLSLVYEQKTEDVYSKIKDIDPSVENKSLTEIFRKFNIPEKKYGAQTNNYFLKIDAAIKNMDNRKVTINDFMFLMNAWRIHYVIQEWNKLIDRQKDIYNPKDSFIRIVNKMLIRKDMVINERNEIVFLTPSGKRLLPYDLSSGEKQLLIILGETMLQMGNQSIYIADEPELSLHVDWQVNIVDNLRQLNPSCQIICATHSPDIVSHYASRVHQMENLIR